MSKLVVIRSEDAETLTCKSELTHSLCEGCDRNARSVKQTLSIGVEAIADRFLEKVF